MENQHFMSAGKIDPKIANWFNERWASDMGAIDGNDLAFIAALIEETRPKVFVEIGCASGFSTSLIAMLLHKYGKASLHSFDILEKFYADPSKNVGYLVSEAGEHGDIDLSIHKRCTSLDVAARITDQIDMCFIDAAHKHPWPLVDTLAVLPLMRPGGVIVHHDLQMYKGTGNYALGPKVLFDHLTEEKIEFGGKVDSADVRDLKTRNISNNIYGMVVPNDKAALARRLSDAFFVGWDRDFSKRIPEDFANRFSEYLSKSFEPKVGRAFQIGLQRYNPSAGHPQAADHSASVLRKALRRVKRMVS